MLLETVTYQVLWGIRIPYTNFSVSQKVENIKNQKKNIFGKYKEKKKIKNEKIEIRKVVVVRSEYRFPRVPGCTLRRSDFQHSRGISYWTMKKLEKLKTL